MCKTGFNLVELLVVIALISLLGMFGSVGFSRFSEQTALTAATKSTVAIVRQTQNRAKLEHQTIAVELSSLQPPAGITISSTSQIRFSSSGNPPPGGSGTIILQNRRGQIKKIIIASNGRVRFE